MSTYKGNTRKIRDGIVTILNSISYNNEPAFKSVTNNTADQFDGYPVARVLPNKMANTTADSESYDHAPSFTVIITWPLADPNVIEEDLFNAAMDYVDLVVDTVEHADRIDALVQNDGTLPWNFMDVTQAVWDSVRGKTGGALLAVFITVEVTYSKNAA